MTPKEKAFYLMNKFIRFHRNGIYNVVHEDIAKIYALIAVAEILSETEERDGMRVINNPYWLEVRNEIEKL
jgi:hypothetical protein